MPRKRSAPPQGGARESATNGPPSASSERERFLKAVAAEIKKARVRVDLNVSDLHRQTGISRTVLQGYENGKFAPGAWELRRLCEALKVSPNKVLFGTEKPMANAVGLAALIGDMTKAENSVKVSVVMQLLSSDELGALLSLLEGLVVPRVGGMDNLKSALSAVTTMLGAPETPSKIDVIGAWMERTLTAEQLAEFTRLASEMEPPKR